VSDIPVETNTATLRVKAGPLAGPLLTRVVAMMLARAQCPVDRLDDAMVICDALAAHAPAHAQDGRLQFTVHTRQDGMQLRVGELAADGAHRVAHAATVPGIGNVLQSIADDVRVEPAADADNDQLVLELRFGKTTSLERLPAGGPDGGVLPTEEPSGARARDHVSADQGLVEP
jgi:serine/threonine-protein kinase RsbW